MTELTKSALGVRSPSTDTFNKIVENLVAGVNAFANGCNKAIEAFYGMLTVATIEKPAFIRAAIYHPEWVAIYKRTKKARIRKKYRDRIVRWYLNDIRRDNDG